MAIDPKNRLALLMDDPNQLREAQMLTANTGGGRVMNDGNVNALSSLMQPVNSIRVDSTGEYVNQDGGRQATPYQFKSGGKSTTINGDPATIFPDGNVTINLRHGGLQRTNMEELKQQEAMRQRQYAASKEGMAAQDRAMKIAEFEMKQKIGQAGINKLNNATATTTSKPIPATALKMQQEELDAIGTASALNKDLGAFTEMVESGKLPLGMIKNLNYKAQNLTGYSTPESRNYASFQANLERLRNESLRLNKGVQTEGDAVRAWNEILANINDPRLVAQRLKEVQKVNERAIQFRKMNVDAIRSNYGKDPLDVSGRENVNPAYGSGGDTSVDELLNLYK